MSKELIAELLKVVSSLNRRRSKQSVRVDSLPSSIIFRSVTTGNFRKYVGGDRILRRRLEDANVLIEK